MEFLESRILSLKELLHIVFKRKKQILFFFLITVCIVAIRTFVAKPTYVAKAQILVKIGRENFYVPPNSTTSKIITPNLDNQINSEIELLRSRSLAENVLKTIGLKAIYKNLDNTGTLLKYQKSLSVKGIEKSNVIEISFKHKDPKMAAKIVNTLSNVYFDQHLLVYKNTKLNKFFEGQSQILLSKKRQAEEKFSTFKKQHNITDLNEELNLLLSQIADFRAEMNRTISQEAETKNRILQIRRQLDKTPETITQGEVVGYNSPLISNLEARLVELQLKEKELLTKYTPQVSLVQNVKEKIQMVRDKIAEQSAKQYEKKNIERNATYQRLKDELFRNQSEQKSLAAKKKAQNTQLAELQDGLEKLNEIEFELKQLQEAVDMDQQNYRFYMTKLEESRISDAMDNQKITNVSLIDPAFPPLHPDSPRVFLYIVLAIFLGGFGGFGLAFFAEFMDDSLEKPEDVEKALQLPVLASIPELEMKGI
jgi:uncharacterized protein involved in exopolysaccharide biosynthesis